MEPAVATIISINMVNIKSMHTDSIVQMDPFDRGCGSVLTSCFTFPVGTHCNDFFFFTGASSSINTFFFTNWLIYKRGKYSY